MRALLVFPDAWFAYSPSATNTAKLLAGHGFDVTVIATTSSNFQRGSHDFHIEWVRLPGGRLSHHKGLQLRRLRRSVDRWTARNGVPDLAIGFDGVGYLAAISASPDAVFYSLEIGHDRLTRLAIAKGIRHLVTQSAERATFLLGEADVPFSIVPNSPVTSSTLEPRSECGRRLIYFGTMHRHFALEDLIESLEHLPDFTLTLRGSNTRDHGTALLGSRRDLVEAGRLKGEWAYLDDDEVEGFLSGFDIGICLYDFKVVGEDNINYLTSPSGKMFHYFNSGIPVVGIDIPGLSPIREYGAGVLIGSTHGEDIAGAVHQVVDRYAEMSAGAVEAARAFDFGTAFDRFLHDVWPRGGRLT